MRRVKSKKGGSPASNRVYKLISCKKQKKYGGSLSQKILEKALTLKCIGSKKNPGPFPPPNDVTLKDIFQKGGKSKKQKKQKKSKKSKKQKKQKKQKGKGSDWISVWSSYSVNPSKGAKFGFPNLINYFTKTGNQYIQVPKTIFKGPMFNPLSFLK